MRDDIFDYAPAFVALDRDLTTNSLVFEQPERDDLQPIAFPVFDHEDACFINVQGAAMAVATMKPSYADRTEDIARDIDWRGGFDANTREHFQAYYRDNTMARSLLSLPISQYDPHGEPQAIFGVLSIYANRQSILGSEQRALRFAMLCGPLLSTLATLLNNYWLAEQAEREMRHDAGESCEPRPRTP